MTIPGEALYFDVRPRGRHRARWRRGLRALRALLRDPARTELALEITNALDGDPAEAMLQRMLAHGEGRRLYEERPSLLAILSDREALARMPAGSFGRAYLEHIERYDLDAGKLVELSRAAGWAADPLDPGLAWVVERSQLVHDLGHVLTGYGADEVGEAALLPFSLAQQGGRANALLTLGATLKSLRFVGPRWLAYAWRAWRRGRRAVCLAALPYERLLPLPLDEVRAAANIDPPELVHRTGVLRGDARHVEVSLAS